MNSILVPRGAGRAGSTRLTVDLSVHGSLLTRKENQGGKLLPDYSRIPGK